MVICGFGPKERFIFKVDTCSWEHTCYIYTYINLLYIYTWISMTIYVILDAPWRKLWYEYANTDTILHWYYETNGQLMILYMLTFVFRSWNHQGFERPLSLKDQLSSPVKWNGKTYDHHQYLRHHQHQCKIHQDHHKKKKKKTETHTHTHDAKSVWVVQYVVHQRQFKCLQYLCKYANVAWKACCTGAGNDAIPMAA